MAKNLIILAAAGGIAFLLYKQWKTTQDLNMERTALGTLQDYVANYDKYNGAR